MNSKSGPRASASGISYTGARETLKEGMHKPLLSDNFNFGSHGLKSGDNGIAKVQSLDISANLFQVVCQPQEI